MAFLPPAGEGLNGLPPPRWRVEKRTTSVVDLRASACCTAQSQVAGLAMRASLIGWCVRCVAVKSRGARLVMRVRSSARSGLWSKERGTKVPSDLTTMARESPALATVSEVPRAILRSGQ